MENNTSLRKAVNEKCKDCSYDPDEIGMGSWRNQVLHCSVRICPLYSFRPLPVGMKYRDEKYLEELPEESENNT
jgi:hypothetical protein